MYDSGKKWLRILTGVWLSFSTFTGLLTLVPWFLVILMTPLLFDEGWSNEGVGGLLIVFAFPLLPLGACGLAWFLYAVKRHILASVVAVTNFVPVAWVVVEGAQR